jgi:hypothetical protein
MVDSNLMPRPKIIFLLILLCISVVGSAQTMNDIKARLDTSYSRIWELYRGDYDSLLNENIRLKDYLITTLPKVSESLTTYFPRNHFAGAMDVTSSPDNKFREWSWSTMMGGTMPVIWRVFQYQTSKGIKVNCPVFFNAEGSPEGEEGFPNYSFDTIFSIVGKNGVTYYMPVEGWKGDSRSAGRTLKTFVVKDTILEFGVKLFKTKNGLVDKIPLRYDSDDEALTWDYVQDRSFKFINKGKTLLVPLLSGNDNNELPLKYLRYDFDGEYFVYKGTK